MVPIRPFHRLACGVLIVLTGGCARDADRVLAPTHASGAAAVSHSRSGRAHSSGQVPCDPSYLGPVLTLFGPGLEYHYPTGGYCPCPESEVPIDVPEHQAVTFTWSADASGGCTDVRAYRWALDIAEVTDETPRIDEATDLQHWSAWSLTASANVGPFTISQAGPNVHRLYIDAGDLLGYRSLGIIRINVVQAVNRPPDVLSATAALDEAGPPNGDLSPVRILGVTDPDGDVVTIRVTGITQDEPLVGRGERPTCPDAAIVGGVASVRRERSGTGNGRVYTIEFTAEDGRGGVSHGTAEVCIPRDGSPNGDCLRDALVVNSLGSCGEPAAGRMP